MALQGTEMESEREAYMTRKKDPMRGMTAEERVDYLESLRDERDRELDQTAQDAVRDLDEKIKAMKEERKRLKSKASAAARRRRNHRLIKGAATVESIAGELNEVEWRFLGNVMRAIKVCGEKADAVTIEEAARIGEGSYQSLRAREDAAPEETAKDGEQGRLL